MPQNVPNLRFHRLIEQVRLPVRADRSAAGTLPTRAFRYCEAVTAAAGFGWWVFPPSEITLVWDGETVFWQYEDNFLPLTSAQFPHFAETFDRQAPASLHGCSPPFLTALPEPGTVQVWTGLIAQTAPEWSLLLRAPANLPAQGGYVQYEGLIEADHWFGPLFTNIRLTRTHSPIRLAADYPLALAQPIPRQAYAESTLNDVVIHPTLADLAGADWTAYEASIAEPSRRPARSFGEYAVASRKRRCPVSADQAKSGRPAFRVG